MFKMVLMKYSIYLFVILNFLFDKVTTKVNYNVIKNIYSSENKILDQTMKFPLKKSEIKDSKDLITANNPECYQESNINIDVLKQCRMFKLRVKREPKINPRSSFLLWKRRNRDTKQLKIRRKSIQDIRFKHTHSTGIKQKVPNNQVNRFKRSKNDGDLLKNDDTMVSNITEQGVILNFNNSTEPIPIQDEGLNSTEPFANFTDSIQDILNSTTKSDDSSLEKISFNNETNKTSLVDIELNQKQYDITTAKSQILDLTQETFGSNKLQSDPFKKDTIKDFQQPQIPFNISSTLNETKTNNLTLESNNATDDILLGSCPTESIPITGLTDKEKDSNKTAQSRIEKQLLFNQTISESLAENITGNVSLLEKDQIDQVTVHNRQQLEETKELVKLQIKNETANSTIGSNSGELFENINQTRTTQKTEVSSHLARIETNLKKVKPNPNVVKWIKGNTLQLPVLTIPFRKCPQGQRMRRGKCVPVY